MKVLVYCKNGKGETTYKRTVEVKPTIRAIKALSRKHEEGMDWESRVNFGDFKVQIIYRNNKCAIVFGNGNESIEPYNYDSAHGILIGVAKIIQIGGK